jgi:hypothetical protein
MNNNEEQVCENCGKPTSDHWVRGGKPPSLMCELGGTTEFAPKPTPDPKVEQCEYCVPICYKGAAGVPVEQYLEAARKEQDK